VFGIFRAFEDFYLLIPQFTAEPLKMPCETLVERHCINPRVQQQLVYSFRLHEMHKSLTFSGLRTLFD